MSEVKRYDAVHLRYEDSNIRYGEGCEVEVVAAYDYARLEQECERLKRDRKACLAEFKVMTRSCLDAERERDAALNQADCLRDLLTRCQEHLEPHRDAALWSDVCAALGPKP